MGVLCPGLALGRSGSGSVALSSRARAGSGLVSVLSGWFGDGPFVVVGEAEREKALEVDGGAAVRSAELVAFDSSVAQAPMFSGEPGEGAFDHGPLLAVDGVEFVGFGLGSCGGEQVVLGVQADDPSGFGGGAEVPNRTSSAVPCESGGSCWSDGNGDVLGAGHGAGGSVDGEVIESEPAVNGGS